MTVEPMNVCNTDRDDRQWLVESRPFIYVQFWRYPVVYRTYVTFKQQKTFKSVTITWWKGGEKVFYFIYEKTLRKMLFP